MGLPGRDGKPGITGPRGFPGTKVKQIINYYHFLKGEQGSSITTNQISTTTPQICPRGPPGINGEKVVNFFLFFL